MKVTCSFIGENGNIFNLLGIACRALNEYDFYEEAAELEQRIWGGEAQSYCEALGIIMEYVDIE